MWEIRNTTSYRGSLGRSILSYVLAAVIAAFLWVVFATTQAFAADASWSGDNVSYSGQNHQKRTADGTTPPGLSSGTSYYYRSEVTNALTGEGKAHVIHFSGNEGSASTAKYTVYKLNSNGSYGGVETAARDISITPKNSNASQPASSTNAAWSGGNISFDGKTLTGQGGGARTADGSTPAQITAGSPYYMYSEITNALTGEGTAHVVFFPTGSDPKTASSARYATYSVSSDGTLRQRLSGPTNITVSPATIVNPDTGETESTESETASTCVIDGIGWIVCPVSTFLAEGMDWVFDQLRLFMEYNLLTGENRTIFQAWSVARNIANVAFVIAFIIIIYSQLTSMGIGNYGIKKLFPRLIIAAILVNLSYIICALAIDISNILGHAVQDLFVMLRESLTNANPNTMNSWASITGFVLAGGTAAAAGTAGLAIAVTSAGASPVAAALLLLPMLLTLLLAILVALVVLAARHAVITMLVILAPLAFVAYLLPNTEDWFTKWRKTFMTLLIFFPAFSLIFGGSQLAGFLIRDSSDQIAIILLGMFVQIAPLVLTPMLIKFSGSVVGRIANIVNNPNKGLIDRTKKWTQGQSEYFAKKNMARTDPVKSHQLFRRFALGMDDLGRARDERLKVYGEQSDARWSNSQEYSDIQQRLRRAQDTKAIGVDSSNLRYEASKAVAGEIQNLDVNLRTIKLNTENTKMEVDNNWENLHTPAVAQARLQAKVLKDVGAAIHSTHEAEYEEFKHGVYGHTPINANTAAMLRDTQESTRRLALNSMRNESAKRAVTEQFTADLEANTQRLDGQFLQDYAGGIQGITGAQRALASAVNSRSKTDNESISNAQTILAHGNYSDTIIRKIALGNSAGTGITVTDDMRKAAIRKTAGGPNTDEIIELMKDIHIDTSAGNLDFRQEFHDALMANGSRPKWATAGVMAGIKQGIAPPAGQSRIDSMIVSAFNANKFSSADVIVDHDKSYMGQLKSVLQTQKHLLNPDALKAFKEQYDLAHRDNRYVGRIGDSKQVLDDIGKLI